MYESPVNGTTLNLAGDLIPTVNGKVSSGYIAQLVFSESTCSDMSKLSQINVHPVYETCTQFVDGFFTLTTMDIASNGIRTATDHYCNDAACSSSCIYGVTWNMPGNCSAVPGSDNLFSYYLPVVKGSGMTVVGFNKTTPTGSSTVPAPTPTGLLNGASGGFDVSRDWHSLYD